MRPEVTDKETNRLARHKFLRAPTRRRLTESLGIGAECGRGFRGYVLSRVGRGTLEEVFSEVSRIARRERRRSRSIWHFRGFSRCVISVPRRLADHWGRCRAFLTFLAVASIGYVIYLFSPSWPFLFVGLTFVMAWQSMASPAIFATIGDALPKERRAMGFTSNELRALS